MKKTLFILLMVFHTVLSYAFTYHSYIETLSTKEGLANNTIYCITQDASHFMWFGTDMGISRYDGFHFRNFLLADSPRSIETIQEISNGVLLMKELRGSIYGFDRLQEKPIAVEADNSIPSSTFLSYQICGDSLLYAATQKGLFAYRIELHTHNGVKRVALRGAKQPLYKDHLLKLCKADNGMLYGVKSNGNIIAYNLKTAQRDEHDLSHFHNYASTPLCNRLFVSGGCIWICRKWAGVFCYNLHNRTGQLLQQDKENSLLPIQYTDVQGVQQIGKQQYCVTTRTGLYCLTFGGDPASSPFSMSDSPSLINKHSPLLETRMFSDFYSPDKKQLWIGTFGGGIIKINIDDIFHNQIYLDENIQVNGLAEDNNGYVWLATNNSGIMKSSQPTIDLHTSFAPWRKAGSPTDKYIVHKDKHGQLWFGSADGEIIRVDPATDRAQRYRLPEASKARINNILYVAPDSVWLASCKGILLFNPATQAFKEFRPFKMQERGVTSVTQDEDKNLWIGTERGLMKMVVADSVSFQCGYEERAGLRPSMVYSLQQCQQNLILATYADKVILLDCRQPDHLVYKASLGNGMSNGHIYCAIEDSTRNIWLGSNSGIMTLGSNGSSFYNYLHSGNNNVVCQLHDGRLLWSNSWGLLFYNPAILNEDRAEKSLFVSEISVNHKPVRTNESVNGQVILPFTPNTLNNISFNHLNNNFTLFFTDLQYNNTTQKKTTYRLLPDDPEWTEASLEQGVSFRHLKRGTHTLQIYITCYDGSKGPIKELKIHILPRWYETIPARLSFLALAVCLVLCIRKCAQRHTYKHRVRQRMLQQKEITEQRNELFILVAHELRTPLSLIIAPIDEVMHTKNLPQEVYSRMEFAYKNARSMQNTCDQLLEIANHKDPVSTYPDVVLLAEEQVMSIQTIMGEHEEDDKHKKKLLIVEDNSSIRYYLQLLLHTHYVIFQATNGQVGVEMALKEMPDLILCDIMMPVKDGLSCCRDIKNNPQTCHIPIIILTAKVEDKYIIEGTETGADDYLTKPFNPDLLRSKIKNLIDNRIKLKQSFMQQMMIPHEEQTDEPEESPETVDNTFIDTVVGIIEKNIDNMDFTVKKLADDLQLSQPTLYRRVKKTTGFTTSELIRGIRLKHAAILLKEQQYSVQEVAEQVGYNDVPTFRKHFTDFFGTLPSNYGKA